MSRYRRTHAIGGSFFFTVNLANRQSSLLIEQIELLRSAYRKVQQSHPFETIAICVLPNHLHAIWRLPQEDGDYSLRWRLIKKHFSAALPANPNRSVSKIAKGEKGIWQRRFGSPHPIRAFQPSQTRLRQRGQRLAIFQLPPMVKRKRGGAVGRVTCYPRQWTWREGAF